MVGLGICLCSGGWAAAQESTPLFLDSLPSVAEEVVLRASSGLAHPTFARLNPLAIDRLMTVSAAPVLRLALNLAGDEEHEVALERREAPGAGRVVWQGRVVGRSGSTVTLALTGGALAGSVFIPGRGLFQVQHAGQGWQRIVHTDGSEVPRCGVQCDSGERERRADDEQGDSASGDVAFQAASAPGDPTNAVIDLLMVYTPAARDGAGGTEGMNALLDAAVAEANLAFANSQVNARLRLVHRAEVSYVETGDISEDLDELEETDEDGPLAIVHRLRAEHRADLVCLITETTGGPYGLANLMDKVEVEFGRKAFSIVQRQYANAYQTLAHELGHNLGCQHDRATSSGGGAFEFSHGHRFEADGTWYRTIMAYQPGLPIPHFSNPDVLFLGVPTGIPEAETNSANNARTINLSAATVARFDSIMPTGTPPRITLTAPTNGAVFFVPAVLELTAEASDDDGQIVEVEFYVNGARLEDRHSPPFTLLWTNATPGTFTFRAEARDDAGWKVESSRVTVTFTHPPPIVDAAGSQRLPDGSFQVRVRGIDGQAFRLEVSSNLADWSPLTTDSLLGEVFDFVDAQAGGFPVRFYRAVPVP